MDDEVVKHVIAETRERNNDRDVMVDFLKTNPPVLTGDSTGTIGTCEWCNNMDMRF